ncbi:hypothetical protein [Pantoea ananatis]|uniref:hypothetical protein n=1 Tax=Pantoea ananas TaxID=553 RepID=UPI00023231E5|nr:hypothetical protein [Pantoea ananatis]AER31191.1 putative prophage protein [Pantoea ananatis PA13]
MDKVLIIFSFAFFVLFLVGLIKPSVVKMKDRKKASLVYFGLGFVSLIAGASMLPDPDKRNALEKSEGVQQRQFQYNDLKLSEYRIKDKDERHAVVTNFINSKSMNNNGLNNMYACLSEYSMTKSGDLPLGTVLDWCYKEFERAPSELSKKVNFDHFQSNISAWDASYRPLEKLIKDSMNDESSYEHVSTTYSFILNDNPHAVVKTSFRGKNGYGAVVKNTVTARVNIQTGEVEKITDQN